jgi:short-subunit dehydrogenase
MATFAERFGPWAIIAGASQGIGEQFSRQLAAKGLNILMIARGKEGLEQVASVIRKEYPVEVVTVPLDLADPDLAAKVHAAVGERQVGLMVYNAVYSRIGEFFADDISSKLQTVDVNCRGPLVFLHELVPPMIARKRGGVILMSSMSGFQGCAMVTTYAATKAFNTVLAEGLWEELRHHNVDLLCCVAGATTTPNFNRQTPTEKVASVMPMEPADVVSEALMALERGKGPTRIVGLVNKLVYFLFSRYMSRKMAVSFISRATRNLYH